MFMYYPNVYNVLSDFVSANVTGFWMIFVCLMEDDDAVVRQEHELCGGHWSVQRMGRGDYKNWMVVDAVKNMDDDKPAEVDREDGLWMMFFVR